MGKFYGFLMAQLLLLQPAWGEVALVYNGPGVCKEGCVQAAADVAIKMGLQVKLVGSTWTTPAIFKDASIWIHPGGDAIQVAKALNFKQKQMIREFVGTGGAYLGFCAGAFFADTWVDDFNTVPGLAIIPGTTQDFTKVKNPMILPINWQGKLRHLYFEEGAYFLYGPKDPVLTIATYQNGLPAAIHTIFGKGRVAVTGVHPEAPKAWKVNLDDPDGSDEDLAAEMLRWALGY